MERDARDGSITYNYRWQEGSETYYAIRSVGLVGPDRVQFQEQSSGVSGEGDGATRPGLSEADSPRPCEQVA